MADWQDEGLILGARRHGERGVILHALTEHHGVAHGFLPHSKQAAALAQPGSLCHLNWRARLADHLGVFKAELVTAYAAPLLMQRGPLLALQSSAQLVRLMVPEGAAHPTLYHAWHTLLKQLNTPTWRVAYTHFELSFLTEVGFGLALERCVVTGAATDLCYVSPKSGCAVSAAAGAPYHAHMLPLPAYLRTPATHPVPDDLKAAFQLTGYFLARAVEQMHQHMPEARGQLAVYFK